MVDRGAAERSHFAQAKINLFSCLYLHISAKPRNKISVLLFICVILRLLKTLMQILPVLVDFFQYNTLWEKKKSSTQTHYVRSHFLSL